MLSSVSTEFSSVSKLIVLLPLDLPRIGQNVLKNSHGFCFKSSVFFIQNSLIASCAPLWLNFCTLSWARNFQWFCFLHTVGHISFSFWWHFFILMSCMVHRFPVLFSSSVEHERPPHKLLIHSNNQLYHQYHWKFLQPAMGISQFLCNRFKGKCFLNSWTWWFLAGGV